MRVIPIAALAFLATFALPAARASAGPPFFSIDVRDTDIFDVLRLVGAATATNIVADGTVKHERVTIRLRNVSLDEALSTITKAYDLQSHRDGNVVMLGSAETMNRRYATDDGALGTQTVVVTLRYAAADDAAKALHDALPAGTLVVPDRRTSAVIVSGGAATIDRARRLLNALDGAPTARAAGLPSAVIPLRYLKPSDAVKALKGLVPETGVIADDRQNAVIVSAPAEIVGAARTLLSALDVPSRQVTFEVRVADVTPENATSNVGLIFGGLNLQGQPLAGAATTAFVHNSVSINATLNAMIENGHASILSQPRLTTLNNREADMLVGSSYPVVYFDARTGTQQVQFVDIGVKLRLTPTIGDDGTITAEVHPEYSEITGFQQGFPIIGSRKVNAVLRVRDGETIVLAGLLSDFTTETVQKLPGLGDIPVFGGIFRNRSAQHQRDEIVFLITPHISAAPKG